MKFAKTIDLKKQSAKELTKTLRELVSFTSKLKSELRAGHSKDQKNYKLAKKQIAVIQTILSEQSLNQEENEN
jgi:ribosomal protein L29